MPAKLPIIKEPHPAKALLCLPSPPAGRGWGWGSSGLISNQADIIFSMDASRDKQIILDAGDACGGLRLRY
ncbi:MAG: hypothetical protein KME50_03110 [Nostoc desertorum CM1-VF14]|jgi:hypothetical protein|nr:hypothetical protein [Nostoc desertorum CM1-VF14]